MKEQKFIIISYSSDRTGKFWQNNGIEKRRKCLSMERNPKVVIDKPEKI